MIPRQGTSVACSASIERRYDLMGTSITLGGPDLAERHAEAICRLYDEVFSEPPFAWEPEESRRHRELLARLQGTTGFGIAVATGEQLVGFAYGFRLPADHTWLTLVDRPLHVDDTAEWEGRTFAFIDLAVAAGERDRGLGRRLIDTLLQSRDEDRMLLTVQPTALRTQAIYRHLRFRHLGRKGPVEGAVCEYWDLYTADLHGGRGEPER